MTSPFTPSLPCSERAAPIANRIIPMRNNPLFFILIPCLAIIFPFLLKSSLRLPLGFDEDFLAVFRAFSQFQREVVYSVLGVFSESCAAVATSEGLNIELAEFP